MGVRVWDTFWELVASDEIEWLLAVEGEDFGVVDGVSLFEYHHLTGEGGREGVEGVKGARDGEGGG